MFNYSLESHAPETTVSPEVSFVSGNGIIFQCVPPCFVNKGCLCVVLFLAYSSTEFGCLLLSKFPLGSSNTHSFLT